MKNLFFLILFTGCLSLGNTQKITSVFAIECKNSALPLWNHLIKINTYANDLNKNRETRESQPGDYSYISGKQLYSNEENTGSAALAFEGKTKRLFFVSLLSGEVAYSEISANGASDKKAIGSVSMSVLGKIPAMGPENQGSLVTRFTAAPDGYVYGLSNDCSVFFRINAADPKAIEPLEAINVSGVSVSNGFLEKERGWGGDMIADATGNFYIFSASGNVFRFDRQQKTMNHLGKVFGLPKDYAISGAAVQSSGAVLLSASSGNQTFEIRDMKTLLAQLVNSLVRAAIGDLASSGFLNEKAQETFRNVNETIQVSAFPNPVVGGQFTLQLQGLSGETSFQTEVLNLLGKTQLIQSKNISHKQNTIIVPVQNLKAGAYFVKVSSKENFSQVLRIVVP